MANADRALALATQIAEAVFARKAEMTREGQTMKSRDVIACITGVLVRWRISEPKSTAAAAGAKLPSKSAEDETWLGQLQALPAYQGINIRQELGRCSTWCNVNRKVLSRRRFVNWLNKVEAPMTQGGPRGAARSIYVEPPTWRETLRHVGQAFDPERLAELLAGRWDDLPITVREMILKAR
jgi:hypothetical protein